MNIACVTLKTICAMCSTSSRIPKSEAYEIIGISIRHVQKSSIQSRSTSEAKAASPLQCIVRPEDRTYLIGTSEPEYWRAGFER